MSRSLLYLFCVLAFVCCADAKFIYVDVHKGDDLNSGLQPNMAKKTIAAAISVAADNDQISVYPGTYTGSGNRNLSPGSRNIVIQSYSGKELTIIDAEGQDRVFNIHSAPSTAKIKGFTIRNGYTPTILTYGGGGGGVCLTSSSMTIEDCIITECSGPEGAGMLVRNSTGVKIIDCVFINNTASHASMTSKAAGVSIFLSSGIEFKGCRFISNRIEGVGHNGGAIYMYRYDASFSNCLFEGNHAVNSGGVAFVEEAALQFDHCTFYGNSCGGNGGCFWIGYTGAVHEVVCTNSIFYDNSCGNNRDGPVAFVNGMGPAAGGIFRYGYCCINPQDIDLSYYGGGTVHNLGGSINVDPMFANPGYWDTGSSSWQAGDYHLKSMVGRYNDITGAWDVDSTHSQCIDAGDPSGDYSNEPGSNGKRVNLGMYGATSQASKSPYCRQPIAADLSGDCMVDIIDFAMFAEEWLICDMVPQDFCW